MALGQGTLGRGRQGCRCHCRAAECELSSLGGFPRDVATLRFAELTIQEMNTIESSQKQKTQQYQLAKGALNTLQRKQQ